MPRAVLVWGGWDGHQPQQTTQRFNAFLVAQGYTTTVHETLDVYLDQAVMGAADLIVQCWTMGTITKEQFAGLRKAVEGGAGLAGWHGGLGDSFRNSVDYQFLIGGQWVAHPGGIVDYTVNITGWDDPITAGLNDFSMKSEQYYMHVDPSNRVLATTSFTGAVHSWIAGATIPVVWKRRWAAGRIFYSSLGHVDADFAVPEARIIMERGLLWATRPEARQ